MTKPNNHEPKESNEPDSKYPQAISVEVKNGTTIDAKNTKPMLESVSETNCNWESDNIHKDNITFGSSVKNTSG